MNIKSHERNTNHAGNDTGFDKSRRLALKMIGGTAVLAHGIVGHSPVFANVTTATETPASLYKVENSSGTELTISLSIDPAPSIRLTNHTTKLIIVRHVYPGLIHAANTTFDINSLFERSACAIGAGRSRVLTLEEIHSTQVERDFPVHLYAQKPQRVAAVTGRNYSGLLANSTRSYFV